MLSPSDASDGSFGRIDLPLPGRHNERTPEIWKGDRLGAVGTLPEMDGSQWAFMNCGGWMEVSTINWKDPPWTLSPLVSNEQLLGFRAVYPPL